MGSTAYGDGLYPDSDGNDYGVDSGSIGIVKLSSIDQTNKQNSIWDGHIHVFESDFEAGSILNTQDNYELDIFGSTNMER